MNHLKIGRRQLWMVLAGATMLWQLPCASCNGFQNAPVAESADKNTLRVFIFAGQSNMEGGHANARDIAKFPPFVGLEEPQPQIRYAYCIGRENKTRSSGWGQLQPLNQSFGPELSFGRKVADVTGAPIAIIKCSAGGTHLGGDWNPVEPSGFELYPLALELVKSSLAELDRQGIAYRLEGFMWHQGENDMFDREFKPKYAENLKQFIACWRRDLNQPQLKFYIGELCTKTIWGMDNRENMAAIRQAQKAVIHADPLTAYVATNHNAVEIGGDAGLHYHYGTLGQLEHGVNYADAYLASLGHSRQVARPLTSWPYPPGSKVKLFVLAGHRNMEGELAFRQALRENAQWHPLDRDNHRIAFKYNVAGSCHQAADWEPLGPAGMYDTFGPELSFAHTLQENAIENVAIAKFTHSGSQINDWTPAGTSAMDCHQYPQFIEFIRQSIADLEKRGHSVELAGIFYHLGENDCAFGPYRQNVSRWLGELVAQSRTDLQSPQLRWIVSQQSPPNEAGLDRIDVIAKLVELSESDPYLVHLPVFELDAELEKLVLRTGGVIRLGEHLAQAYLKASAK